MLFEIYHSTPVWELLPGNSIVRDYLQGSEAARRFFSPMGLDELCDAIDKAERPSKKDVASALWAFNQSIGAPAEAMENVQRLAGEDALVIMTGQQPGIMTGPLYTIYKALTAVQLAEVLSGETGRCVIPVFWAASEDHDFKEVSSVTALGGNGELLRLGLPTELGNGKGAVGEIPLEHHAHDLIERYLEIMGEGGHSVEAGALLSRALDGSADLGTLFSRLMSQLLGGQGLVMVDACDPKLKRLANPLFQRAMESPREITAMVNRAGDLLVEAGYRRQIHKHEDLCPFFVFDGGRRENVRLQGDGFQFADNVVGQDALKGLVDDEPQRFSPSAALRPVVSDYLLPTLAYVGGAGEMGYYAQLREVYDHLSVPMPHFRLRKGLTLVDSRTRRTLDKLNIIPTELMDREELLVRLVRTRHDLLAPGYWDERVAAAGSLLDEIRDDIESIDPSLLGALDNTINSIGGRIRKFEGKLLKSIRRRETLLKEQVDRAAEQIFPDGRLQERVLNIFGLLSVYGWELLQRIKDDVPPQGDKHYFIHIA